MDASTTHGSSIREEEEVGKIEAIMAEEATGGKNQRGRART